MVLLYKRTVRARDGEISSHLEKRKLAGKLKASSQHPQLLHQEPFGSVSSTTPEGQGRAGFQAAELLLCRLHRTIDWVGRILKAHPVPPPQL